jgi:hypothetical protein
MLTVLQQTSILLSSSIPSAIIPALPCVFLTGELHVVTPGVMQIEQLPPHLQVSKIFYSTHADRMREEFQTVRDMGSATAEEWLKGLEDRGKELRNDASRWEKWAKSGGLSHVRTSGLIAPPRQFEAPVTALSTG